MKDINRIDDNGISTDAYQNILSRRSVRKYTGEALSEEQKEALLRAAMAAPSGVNRQPWEFVLIDDPLTLERLAEALPYAKMTQSAPDAIVVCGNSDRFLDGDDAELWVQDVSASSENILLAANALGLGAVWTCLYPHKDRMESVTSLLKLPSNIIPFSLIPIGYPDDPHKPMDKWHPDRVHRNSF